MTLLNEFTVSTAPWWAVASLAGLFALIGGGITVIAGYYSDRRKLNRDDTRQWDIRLKDQSIPVVAIADELYEFQRTEGLIPDVSRAEALTEESQRIAQEFMLIAPTDLVQAVREVRNEGLYLTNKVKRNPHHSALRQQPK